MTAADRLMAPRQSSPCKLLIVVLHANREHRRDAYATLGSAKFLSHGPPTVHVARHSTKLLEPYAGLVDFLDFLLADRPDDTSRRALQSVLEMSKLQWTNLVLRAPAKPGPVSSLCWHPPPKVSTWWPIDQSLLPPCLPCEHFSFGSQESKRDASPPGPDDWLVWRRPKWFAS